MKHNQKKDRKTNFSESGAAYNLFLNSTKTGRPTRINIRNIFMNKVYANEVQEKTILRLLFKWYSRTGAIENLNKFLSKKRNRFIFSDYLEENVKIVLEFVKDKSAQKICSFLEDLERYMDLEKRIKSQQNKISYDYSSCFIDGIGYLDLSDPKDKIRYDKFNNHIELLIQRLDRHLKQSSQLHKLSENDILFFLNIIYF